LEKIPAGLVPGKVIPSYLLLIIGYICLSQVSCQKGEPSKTASKVFHQNMASAIQLGAKDPRAAIEWMDSTMFMIDKEFLPDSDYIEYLQAKTSAYLKLNLKDSAVTVIRSTYQDSTIQGRKNLKIFTALWLVQELIDNGKYFQALKYLEETRPLLENDSTSRTKAQMLNLEGLLSNYKGNYPEAQKRYFASIRIFENVGDTAATGPTYINLATAFQAQGNTKRALHYYRKACEITKAYHDTVNYPIALNNLGTLYSATSIDSAEYFFNRAKSLFPSQPWSIEALSARFHLAGLYYDQQKYDLALSNYEDILLTSKQYGISAGIYRAMSGIGNVYEARNQDGKALEIFEKAYSLTMESGETIVQLQLLEAIRYMHEKMGNLKGAYDDLKKIKSLNDSLFSAENEIAVYDLELMYIQEKAERKSDALNNQIFMLRQKMESRTIILSIVVLAAVILGILLYSTYNLYHQRDIAYNALFEKYRNGNALRPPIENTFPSSKQVPGKVSDEIAQVYKLLCDFFEREKPYLKYNLRFHEVANQLRISHKRLSQLLEQSDSNFTAFVNHYRVKEALRLLAESDRRNYKVEAIAKECGFGSKASFYKAFSDITGSRPTEYRQKKD
jgi:AraC-like DNA-binding protein/Tfp pilus assembly protein PilF